MKRKWIYSAAVLGMIGATMAYIAGIRGAQRLGAPGVRVGPVPVYNELGKRVKLQSVLLPEAVGEVKSTAEPITDLEVRGLPGDTTFGRRRYLVDDQFAPLVTAVLMGTDRTSIHDPHFCLPGEGWTIDETEHVDFPIKKPYPYDLPAIKVTVSRVAVGGTIIRGFYVYWFVTSEKITADQGMRLWSIAKTMVEKKELERWAYISYFVACIPGTEEATFDRLGRFIEASAPAFQTVAGHPTPENEAAPVAFLK